MKERLTGAIILVALIVLLVPELLTGPIRRKAAPAASTTTAAIAAPAADPRAGRTAHVEPPLRSYTLTLGGAQPAHDSVAAQTSAQAGESSQEGSSESPEQTPRTAPPRQTAAHASQQSAGAGSGDLQAAKSPAHTVVRETRSSGSSGGWVVQLGSFASRQNADRLARTLQGRGFRMAVSPARAGSRVLWRVRAGPTHDRAGALRLAARLRALGHRGELIPLK